MSGVPDNWLRGLEVTAHLGIVAGLIVVAVQIRQEADIADRQQLGAVFSSVEGYYETLAGEDPASSMARAVFDPAGLTDRDRIVLDALYSAEAAKMLRSELIFAPAPPDESNVARWRVDLLSNPWGRAWWDANDEMLSYAPRYKAAIEAAMAADRGRLGGAIEQREMFDAIEAALAESSAPVRPDE